MGFGGGHWLKCTGCSKRFDFPESHVYQYTDLGAVRSFDDIEGHCWSVLDLPCWCVDCNRPSFCERVPSLDELMKAAAVRRIPEGPTRHEIVDPLLDLEPESLARLVEQFASRRSKPKCLVCGLVNVLPMDAWARKTPLLHDACGSPIELHAWIGGSIGRREFRFYSTEGDLVGSLTGVA